MIRAGIAHGHDRRRGRSGRCSSTTATASRRCWCRTLLPSRSAGRAARPRRAAARLGLPAAGVDPAPLGGGRYYNAVWRHLLLRTFDELPADRLPERRRPLVGGDARACSASPTSPWWDDVSTPDGGDPRRHPAAGHRRRRRRADATGSGQTRPSWRWGDLHTLDAGQRHLRQVRHRPDRVAVQPRPGRRPGGDAIVNATGWDASEGYEVDAVPSMRMIVDMADLDDSRWIQLTGNSGHAFHPNYDDQFELWRTGQNLPMRWDRRSIEADATDTLTLRP